MSSPESTCMPDAKNIHILYVEDDEGLARLLQKQLKRECGIRVDIASDGSEGLAKLEQHHYDIAIVDYNLPVLNGLQLLQALKSKEIDTPVIMLTGAGNETIAADVMKLGAVDYLIKDVGGEYLTGVCAAVNRVWLERQAEIVKKQLFAKQQLAKKVFDVTKEGIIVTDVHNVIQAINPAFSDITGYAFEEVVGQNPNMLRSERSDDALFQQMWSAINGSGYWEGEIWNKKKSGEEYPEWLSISAIKDEKGVVSEYIGVFTDITHRKEADEKIWHQANYDVLTDLPNRALLVDRANAALQRAQRERTAMALMFVDLDHFKHVNDCYGHAAGDAVLIEVARRISSALRKSDTVIRQSGDEFIVLMPLIHHIADASRVAEKVIGSLAAPYTIGGHKTYLSASAGIAVYPSDGDDVETLLRHADISLYKGKQAGRNQFVFFDSQMNEEAEKRARMEMNLHIALKTDQLLMYYQPVIDLSTNRITHAEALIRWLHPDEGMIMPDEFIPVAEDTGQIIALGDWVIHAVSGQLALWMQHMDLDLQVFLNVSPVQLLHANIDKQMAMVQEKFALERGVIGLEITENILIEGPEKVRGELEKMKKQGLRFLLDDFGTGFSSMRYLMEMPFDGLKIDRSFVDGCDQGSDKAVLVKAMIDMAHSLNLTVVAEGVETEGELALLREFGCDYVQGYLLGRPMPAEQFFERMLAQS